MAVLREAFPAEVCHRPLDTEELRVWERKQGVVLPVPALGEGLAWRTGLVAGRVAPPHPGRGLDRSNTPSNVITILATKTVEYKPCGISS